MLDAVLRSLDWVQYAVLAALWAVFAWWERLAPRRTGQGSVRVRWRINLGLYLVGVVFMLGVYEPVQTAAIRLGARTGWGGVAALDWPDALKIVLGILLVDLIQYLLHGLSHRVPLLWRLHQVHHTDEAFDVSTSVRHHPLEVLVMTALVLLPSAALGIPLLSLLWYALLQLAHTLFSHANVALPERLDRVLRWFVVTPDMHRVHHSARMDEGNSNFGMVFPWWDRLLRTYCAQPAQGHQAMRLGLTDALVAPRQGLWPALWQPFRPGSRPTP